MSNDISIQSLENRIDDLNQQAWDIRVTDSPKAFTLSQESVKLARTINYPPGLAFALQLLGFCYIRLSKYDEALPLLNESLSLFSSLNDLKGKAIIYEYQAIIQRTWGDLGGALELLFKSNDITEQNEFTEIIATNHYQLGVTYKHLGDFEKALDHFYRSMEACRKIENSLFEAYSINLIGSIYFENGDYEHALDYYRQGLVFRHEAGDKLGEAGSLDNIGFTYLKLKNFEQAIEYCSQGLVISRSTDDKRGQANAMIHLAEIYKATNNIERAAGFSNESLEIRKATGDKKGETEIFLFLADLYKAHPTKDKNVFEWLNNSLKIAEEIKAVDLLSKTRFHLYEYYKRKGNFEEALNNLDLHTHLEKEFHKNTIDQKIANLEISHKAEVISQRNKELTELNEQIEKANEELRIEASLERVRSAAMAMKKSEELVIVSAVMFGELVSLGFTNIRNAQIAIENKQRQSFITYVHSDTEQHAIRETPYSSSSLLLKARQNLSTSGAFYQTEYRGKELEEWRIWKKNMGGTLDEKELSATSLQFYLYAIGKGHIGISTFDTITPEQIEIVKRFKNVFELSYQRFDDLQKAEAQARESQIELALERVRARTMAMQKSDELREAVLVIYEQLQQLNFESRACNIIIIDKESGSAQYWVSGFSQEIFPESYMVPYLDHPYQDALLNPWKQGDKYVVYEYTGKMKQSFDEIFFTQTEFRNLPEEAKKVMIGLDSVILSTAFISYGALQALGAEPLSDEKATILKRFAKVFEQTYTRFLDLQKSEAQARESQIQLALERVRARTMAMQHSEELMEAANLLFQQVQSLGISVWSCGYNIWEKGEKGCIGWMSTKGAIQPSFRIPLTEHRTFIRMNESRLKEEPYYVEEVSGEELADHYKYMFSLPDFKEIATKQLQDGFLLPLSQINHVFNFKHGNLIFLSAEAIPEAWDIFKRFTAVFEQTYTRFLDLQKAEAQAREANIETALEKVRSRSLAMRKAEELGEVVTVVVKKLKELDIPVNDGVAIVTHIDGSKDQVEWLENPGFSSAIKFNQPYYDHPVLADYWKARNEGLDFINPTYTAEENKSFLNHIFQFTDYKHTPQEIKDYCLAAKTYSYSAAFQKNSSIFINDYSGRALSTQEIDIVKRFSKVFEQAYVRFLDLQKAEAQAREAQIETALEKVRSHTMGMRSSDDLANVAVVMFEQVRLLGGELFSCGIVLCDENKTEVEQWLSVPGVGMLPPFYVPVHLDYIHQYRYDQWKAGVEIFSIEIPSDYIEKHFELIYALPSMKALTDLFAAKGLQPPPTPSWEIDYGASFRYGYLLISAVKPFEEEKIFPRFAKVFEQTYTRFLDLKKAEAQAREAQIEAALEKVRSRSLAMHKSDELNEVVSILFEKLKELQIPATAVGIAIYINGSKDLNAYVCGENEDGLVIINYLLPYFDHKIPIDFNNAREKQLDFFVGHYSKEEKNSFYQYLIEHTAEFRHLPDDIKRMIFESPTYTITMVAVNNATFNINDFEGKVLSESEVDIIRRFARVFDQAYTRFLDLQKSEAQAREAKIEVALEKVRSRTMAMQKGEELNEVAVLLYKELIALGVTNFVTCGYVEINEKINRQFTWVTSPGGDSLGLFYLPLTGDATFDERYAAWKQQQIIFQQTVAGEVRSKHLEYAITTFNSKEAEEMVRNQFPDPTVFYCFNFSHGYLHLVTGSELKNEEEILLARFTRVFEQTYARFLDLKKAEAQARESQIEAALERIRSRTMGMQKSEELKDVIQVVYEQFVHLNVHVEHTGFIMDYKERSDMHIWLADKHAVPFQVTLPYFDCAHWNSFNEAKEKGMDFFANKLSFEEKNKFYQDLFKLIPGLPEETLTYYFSCPGLAISTVLLDNVGLYIENFSGTPYSDEENATLMRFGKVFQQTYTRFNDLKLAEAHAVQAEEDLIKLQTEKKRAEDALSELQVTQKQLIQSEKMASLGELTAGIAHEIQNPLNFVNNFSDVNKELLVEMKEEIEKGNTEEVMAIANDIISNEEKINHHGKRADAIVKGMLQHSRSSSGVKEPTDINELADEYLRLAYHGLRAKDKSFNATMKTDFDETVGKVNVIPQDIGRVFLNLITNAFYVVNEKKSSSAAADSEDNNYEPVVTVSTKRLGPPLGDGGKIEIRVADNGNGIPQKVLDKIFQPFFTTKPTGQGTGLGLSLSYDIVKAHGGELLVETKEGEGTEFIVSLSVN